MLPGSGLFLLHNWYVVEYSTSERKLTCQGSHYPTPNLITDRDLEKSGEDTNATTEQKTL